MTCQHFAFTDRTPRIGELGLGVAALRYAELGYAVLPLQRGSKRPHHMLGTSGGVHHATRDPGLIAHWWGRFDRAANIGVATGQASGLAVIDLDVKNGLDGPGELERFLGRLAGGELPLAWPGSPWVSTPSGGVHIWLRMYARVLVTGSRTWTDADVIARALAQHWPGILVSGACPRGADAIAERIWRSWGGQVERHPAQWETGRDAGFRRNGEMARAGAGACLAFDLGTPGTADCAAKAAAAGIPVNRYASDAPWPDPVPLSRTVPERPSILPGVDVKGDGGLVVAPPSMQLLGSAPRPGEPADGPVPVPYIWHGCPCSAPAAPGWLGQWLASAPASPGGQGGVPDYETPDLADALGHGLPAGERNARMYRLACSRFRAHGTGPDGYAAVCAELRQVWDASDKAGYPWSEVVTSMRSAQRWVAAREAEEWRLRAAWMGRQ